MATIEEKAYSTGVLVPEVHARLIADIENVAKQAGIPQSMIWTSATEHCGDEELEYLKRLRSHADEGVVGFAYLGKQDHHPIAIRMMALAGACIRNYINAKVMTVQEVLAHLKRESMPKPTVLFVPNFYVGKEQAGGVAQWQLSALYGMLLDRQAEGLQTFLYVEDMKQMSEAYGGVFAAHLNNYFAKCKS